MKSGILEDNFRTMESSATKRFKDSLCKTDHIYSGRQPTMWLLNWRLHSLSGVICHMVFKHCHCSCQFFFFFCNDCAISKTSRIQAWTTQFPIKIMCLHSISNETGMNELLIVKSATHKQNNQQKNRRWCPNSSIRSTFTAAVNRGRNTEWNLWKSPSFRSKASPRMAHILVTRLCTIQSAWKRHQKMTRKKNYLSRF